MQTNTTLETIEIDTLSDVTGGLGGWLGMLTGKTGDPNGLGTMIGGGGGGLNGKGGGLAETVGGWARGMLGGGRSGGVVEGK